MSAGGLGVRDSPHLRAGLLCGTLSHRQSPVEAAEVSPLEMGCRDQVHPGFRFSPCVGGCSGCYWKSWGLAVQPLCSGRAELLIPFLHPHCSKASRVSSASLALRGMRVHPAHEDTQDPLAHEDSSGSAACRGCPASGAQR